MDKEKHIKIIAWLYILNSALLILSAIGVLCSLTLTGLFSGEIAGIVIAPIVALVVAIFMVLLALPGLLAGKGLLEGKGWARVLAMILGALNFFSFPLGTALCVYTFWVLWGKDADPVFEAGYPHYHQPGQR